MQTSRFAIPKTYLLVVGLLALAWLWVGVANAAKVKVYEIRQARMGLAPKDTITVIVTTLEGKYSPELENEVVGCISNAFYEQNLSTVRVVPPNEFRRVAFPDLTPEQVLGQPWNQRMSDPVFRERIAPMGLRYLIAVTVSQGKSLTRYVRARVPHWKWQRIAVMSAKILDLRQLQVSGKVSASVQKTSRFSYAPVPFVIPSFVKGRACEEFGKALASFLTSEKPAKKIIMSSLTLKNLFPQRRGNQEEDQDIYIAGDGKPVTNL
ncbi:MAG: hypothetical protein O7B35_16370, partial [Deltaproteobacteria bacterium]|nr:hypothetical protein [Deltaproteobacteria bacterium]